MTVQNAKNLPGLEIKYAAKDSRSGFTDPEDVWYFFYGKKLPLEFGKMLHELAKRGDLVLLNERLISGSGITPQVGAP